MAQKATKTDNNISIDLVAKRLQKAFKIDSNISDLLQNKTHSER